MSPGAERVRRDAVVLPPAPIRLPVAAPMPGLAAGGDRKSALGVVRGGLVHLSPPLGDLDGAEGHRRYRLETEELPARLGVRPRFFAADLHPAWHSRHWMGQLARAAGADLIGVQHHHAHLASLLAEHGRTERILGIVLDGVGFGLDGTAWGGEILLGDLLDFERVGRLRPIRLPGGDAAAIEVGRAGLAWLLDAMGEDAAVGAAGARAVPDRSRRRTFLAMLAADLNCPPSSGAGRLFDAAAALLGLAVRNSVEGEAPRALEAAAARAPAATDAAGVVPVVERDGRLELDTRSLAIRMLAAGEADGPEVAALLFHEALADGLARAAATVAAGTGIRVVGLTGGVFANARLRSDLAARLAADGLEVLVHSALPCGDGALAVGQGAVAAARLAGGR